MARDYSVLDEGPDDLPRWRKAVPLVLACLLAVSLGSLIFLANRASAERDRALALQRQSFEVIALSRQLEGSIASAEALLARYVVSPNKNIGRQYQDEWRQAQIEADVLERAVSSSRAQAANVAELREAMAERGELLNDIALRKTYQQRLSALGRFYEVGAAPSVPRINTALERTIGHERDELTRRDVQVSRSATRMDRLYSGYGLVGLALLVAALIALWVANSASRERRFARRLAASEVARVDGLEAAVAERTVQLQEANAQLRIEMDERAQAERSLRQMQKMEAIGKLTGGIAHDFNNMLAVIVGGIDLARKLLEREPTKARVHLDSALDGANRAAALTERLLAFARSEPLLPDRIEVDELVQGMRDLIDRLIGDQIEVVMDLDAGEWDIWADRAQLENALLNLAVNARDAMNGRGRLYIGTRQRRLREHEIGQCAAGEYIEISAEDSGAGMSQEVMERAFDPFFTTKPVGKGTGLGLSQLVGFVRQCQGEVTLDSRPDKGTVIRMLLPREHRQADSGAADHVDRVVAMSGPAGPVEPTTANVAQDAQLRLGSLTILVVEDDPRVLRATLAALDALGHSGLSCDHPAKAAAILAAHPETNLILSDVMMPDMTGPEMIAFLGAAVGQKPVIFVTGFAGEGAKAAQIAGYPILRKPFTINQLERAIVDTVTGESSGGPGMSSAA